MTPKEIDRLELFADGIPLGDLLRTKMGCELRLRSDLEDKLGRPWLSSRIPLSPTVQSWEGINLPPYFAGLLPEGLRLKALVKRLKTSEDDLFSLLLASGTDPVGDIHFSGNKDLSDSPLRSLESDFSALRHALRDEGRDPGGHAIAGVQDKLSADRLNVSLKNSRGAHILKLGSPEYPNLVENEAACLSLAKKCGLPVNNHKIVHDPRGESALLVRRFDREWDAEAKRLRRLHQEDACQFLDRYPADKYRLSLQEIAKGVQELCASPTIEILSLLRLKAFSYLCGNGDLHAKNISLLRETSLDAAMRLSPAYDLVCTFLYGDDSMALAMDGKTKNLKRKTFVDFGARFELPPASVESMLDRLSTLFAKHQDLLFSFPLAQQKEKNLRALIRSRLGDLGDRT